MTITIDDYLPFYNGNVLFAGANGIDKNIWAPLLEKAVAKLVGNYEYTNYGWQSESLRFLTGAPTYFRYNADYTGASAFAEIKEALGRGFNVGADTSSSSLFGLTVSHAYHVLGAY